jgi:hypothetical protein
MMVLKFIGAMFILIVCFVGIAISIDAIIKSR